ncbi:MAG: peptidase M30, partial [Spirochaetes bacterium]|nr:peptidase M30 [Spirochaetota bacterium]
MRKRVLARSTAVAALVLLAAGCKPFSGPLPGNPEPAPYFIQHLQGEGTFPVNLDLGDATRDVYLTFVNPTLINVSGSLTVNGSVASRVQDGGVPSARVASSLPVTGRAPTPERITAFNQNPFGGRGRPAPSLRLFEREPPPPSFDYYLETGNFYNDELNSVPATCRAVVTKNISAGIPRTLNIWVANNCWDGSKATTVDQGMVDALADQFLKTGDFNDIYDWVTGMLGPEWGSHPYSDLIPPDDEITIFLCDISDDNSTTGGIVGFFWAKDNFVKGSNPAYLDYYSNERVMFTIDAVMYAVPEGGSWEYTDYWPEEMYSTLAHEFQHMIHFYQRAVLRDAMADDDTWINEMA